MIFADTNVLVYALDGSEPAKRVVATRLLREASAGRNLCLSTQVLQEFYVTMLRRRILSPADAADAVRHWADNEVVVVTPQAILKAAELQQRHGWSFWDALIVQTALDGGCSVLYTEDMQHGYRIAGLEFVNPFLHHAHEPGAGYLQASTPESVDRVLRQAIARKRLIAFQYENRPKEGEPHDYGLIGGRPRLNFFQTRGRSRNGMDESGKWKMLDPKKMTQLRMLSATFAGSRPAAGGAHKRWDSVIASVTPALRATA